MRTIPHFAQIFTTHSYGQIASGEEGITYMQEDLIQRLLISSNCNHDQFLR
jgi:hypothetical protein